MAKYSTVFVKNEATGKPVHKGWCSFHTYIMCTYVQALALFHLSHRHLATIRVASPPKGGGPHPTINQLDSRGSNLEKEEGPGYITGVAQEVRSSHQWRLSDTLIFRQTLYGRSHFYQTGFAQIPGHCSNIVAWWCNILCDTRNVAWAFLFVLVSPPPHPPLVATLGNYRTLFSEFNEWQLLNS